MGESGTSGAPELAKQLTAELEMAFEGLKKAAERFQEVQGRVDNFLDDNHVIPPPPEGLDDEMNDLYQLWNRTPDAEAVQSSLK